MSEPVEFAVRGGLSKIIAELEAVREKSKSAQAALEASGRAVGKNLENLVNQAKSLGKESAGAADAAGDGIQNNAKRTENFLKNLTGIGRRVADQLRGDFKSLISINALQASLKLSNQFKGTIDETIELSDKIRKLGTTFGVAQKDFASFQTTLTKGLGEIGLSSDVAARALDGLSTTPVRGQGNLLKYAQTAGMLASIGGEQGNEGGIANSIAGVIQARGGNVNDKGQVDALAESVRRVFVQTGASPTQTLRMMQEMFARMPQDMRKAFSPQALTDLAAAGAVGGPNATKFLEEYLGQSPIQRRAFEAQGGKGIFTEEGINADKFSIFAKNIMGRVPGDPRLGAKTLGLSDDAAEGFVRLAESLERVEAATDGVEAATGNLSTQYKNSMGLSEAFKANVAKVKQMLATPLSYATQKGTSFLSQTAQSDSGAGMVAAGGGILAALLAGVGLKGVGSLLGTAARKEGSEALLNQKTIPVYVVNASEIGGGLGGLGGGAAGGAVQGLGIGGMAAIGLPIAMIAAAAAAAVKLNEDIDNENVLDTPDAQAKFDKVLQPTEREIEQMQKDLLNPNVDREYRHDIHAQLRNLGKLPSLGTPPSATTSPSGEPAAGQKPKTSASLSPGMMFPTRPQKVVVELATPQLKASVQPTRGAIS